jgi:flagellar biosynthesis protein
VGWRFGVAGRQTGDVRPPREGISAAAASRQDNPAERPAADDGARPAVSDDRDSHANADDRIAVALDYAPREDSAPRVVAKGRGALAEQIVAIAEANGIAIRHDADLASLLSAVEVDSEIPVEAFMAVAQILAYVYRANNKLAETYEAARRDSLQDHRATREYDT